MSIFNTISVEVEVDDIKYDVLQAITDEELLEELEERDKLKYRNKVYTGELLAIDALYASKTDLYQHLCDIAECGYNEPKDSLLSKIKDLL